MEHHPITFEQLADWLDGRLDAGARQEVEAHLAAGCPDCQADLNWLRRFTAAARAPELAAPPAHLIGLVKTQFRPQPTPRRSTLRRSWQWAAMAATLLIMVMGVSLAFITRSPSLIARQARLAVTDGKAEWKDVSSAWQAAPNGATLRESNHLRVTEGQAWLTLFDGSVLELQPGSEIVLASLRSSLLGADQRIAIIQDSGAVRYEVQKLRSERSSFRVQSPVAQISVQGTHFWVTILDKQQTEVAVLEGQVSVTGALDSVSLAPQEAVIALADAPLRRAPFPTQTTAPDEPTPTLDIAERTRTATRTATPTNAGTRTPSAPAAVATAIASATATASTTVAASATATATASPTQTHTSTATGSIVAWTPTGTPSATMTLTATGAPSTSATPTATPMPSRSATITSTATGTHVLQPTDTATPAAPHTPTAASTSQPPAPTNTQTPSPTHTAIPADTPGPTWTSTPTGAPTFAPSATLTVTDTPIPSRTNTPPPTWTQMPTATATVTRTPSSHTIVFQQGAEGYSGCRDVGISIWEPDTLHEGGTNDQIEIRTNDNVAALLRFDLSSIPANATIASASLSLYIYDRFGTRAMTIGAYDVYRSWVAAEATWNQAGSGQRWVAAGCNGIGSDRSGDAAVSVTMNATHTWYDLPITSLAQRWVGNPAANFGLVLKAWGDPAGYSLVTSEHGGAWMRPKLTISYLLPN